MGDAPLRGRQEQQGRARGQNDERQGQETNATGDI